MFLLSGVQEVHAASLVVAWDPSPDSTVAGYVVSYGTASRTYTGTVTAGNSTSVTLSALADGTIYYIAVQAYNSQGMRGEQSSEVAGKTASVTKPLISCPSPVLTSPDGKAVPVSLLAVSTGGVQPVAVGCTPASGSLFSVGTSPFTCTATDAVKQIASCSSTVVVLAPATAPPPVAPPPPVPSPTPTPVPVPVAALTIACPVIKTVTAPRNSQRATVTFSAPVVSGGKLPIATSCTPMSGSQFSVGTTSVSCRATDAAQQLAACTTTATVLRSRERNRDRD